MFRAAILLLVLLSACARVDPDQARVCASIAPIVMGPTRAVRVVAVEPARRVPDAVRIDVVTELEDGRTVARSAICSFDGSGARSALSGLGLDDGDVGAGRLFFVDRFLRERGERTRLLPTEATAGSETSISANAAFLAQALVNGLPGAGLLALLAAGYALVAGITDRFNLAFGDVTAIGGYAALGAFAAAYLAGGPTAAAVGTAVAATMLAATLAGRMMSTVVVAPLVAAPGRMLIVATVGVSLVIEEGLRLGHGAGQRWLPPIASQRLELWHGGGYAVTATQMQLAVSACTFALVAALLWLLRISRFGRHWRAVADDALAARLCGVDPSAVLRTTMSLAGVLAGLAGALIAFAYGNVHYAAGASLGLKAILAAVLGGIGSVPGAALGGVALGLMEALWSAYLPIVFRDMAVYALLSLLLVMRPDGLFGRPREPQPSLTP